MSHAEEHKACFGNVGSPATGGVCPVAACTLPQLLLKHGSQLRAGMHLRCPVPSCIYGYTMGASDAHDDVRN